MNLQEVNGVKIQNKHRAGCHCGAVVLELDLPRGLLDVCRCDCSLCRRKGAVMALVPLAGLHLVKGAEALTLYQFHTNTAKHYFCRYCGVYTHHQRRANPQQYAVNVACLEGINPLKIPDIQVYDGVNHPSDSGE